MLARTPTVTALSSVVEPLTAISMSWAIDGLCTLFAALPLAKPMAAL